MPTYGSELAISELISRAAPRHGGVTAIDQWSSRKASNFKVAGRHVLNLWRVMRSERTLSVYTFENVVFDVLRRRLVNSNSSIQILLNMSARVPRYSFRTLTEWYESSVVSHTASLFKHLLTRARINLEILQETDVVTKTASVSSIGLPS